MAKSSPDFYLKKLKLLLDTRVSPTTRKRKVPSETSVQVLTNLEVALRNNENNWIYEFLNEDNNGLNIIVDYLDLKMKTYLSEDVKSSNKTNSSAKKKKSQRKSSKNTEEEESYFNDDIYLCLLCLKAILKNECGFEVVVRHARSIDVIVGSTYHKNLQVKAIALEILSPICLLSEGHRCVLSTFSRYKELYKEKQRFESLMDAFINYKTFNLDFMEVCTHFVNIIVHTVEDLNFRIHLQYKFTLLGFDRFLRSLHEDTDNVYLKIQIEGYLKNMIDVDCLFEKLDRQRQALEKMTKLEEELIRTNEELRLMETQLISRSS